MLFKVGDIVKFKKDSIYSKIEGEFEILDIDRDDNYLYLLLDIFSEICNPYSRNPTYYSYKHFELVYSG